MIYADEAIKPIWETYRDLKLKYEISNVRDHEKAAFFWAFKEHLRHFHAEISTDPVMEAAGGDDFARYNEEKLAIRIGEALNKSDTMHYWEENGVMGRRQVKTTYVLDLSKNKIFSDKDKR